ncbi:hypothetical protein DM02DRAFT_620954 [Periconia macrospinosa]|uniref:Uncharacterized protein n=1 Tax=Periconia macrospinosa TaxID=97972 RepID=A0A2V1CYL4_9PLEO|nr:hypothetical protein DM02DRAFT_620954 [Periconia macrospinosa]
MPLPTLTQAPCVVSPPPLRASPGRSVRVPDCSCSQTASRNSMERKVAERHEGPSHVQKHTGTYKESTEATQGP